MRKSDLNYISKNFLLTVDDYIYSHLQQLHFQHNQSYVISDLVMQLLAKQILKQLLNVYLAKLNHIKLTQQEQKMINSKIYNYFSQDYLNDAELDKTIIIERLKKILQQQHLLWEFATKNNKELIIIY